MPMSAANAQALEPDATGTIVCKVAVWDGTNATVQYPVEVFWSTTTVVGRWGTGRDVGYQGFTNLDLTVALPRSYTVYLYKAVDPNNLDTYEQTYAEAVSLDIRVDKQGVATMSGKSIGFVDYPFGDAGPIGWTASECTWKLSGRSPLGSPP
ncbi:MAG TPA: hypothetical protein VFP36_08985 [Usitatibacter sp.]|nr:hypothetical protein [Usitatibacter sp.]